MVVENTAKLPTERLPDHQHYFVILNVTLKTDTSPKYVLKYIITVAMHNGGHEVKSDEVYNSSDILIINNNVA